MYREWAEYLDAPAEIYLADIILWQTAWTIGSLGAISFDACGGPRRAKVGLVSIFNTRIIQYFILE